YGSRPLTFRPNEIDVQPKSVGLFNQIEHDDPSPSRAKLAEEWGSPSSEDTTPSGCRVLVYGWNGTRFRGVMLWAIVPGPLVVPLGSGTRVYFQGEEMKAVAVDTETRWDAMIQSLDGWHVEWGWEGRSWRSADYRRQQQVCDDDPCAPDCQALLAAEAPPK